jgi:hypothetical protein
VLFIEATNFFPLFFVKNMRGAGEALGDVLQVFGYKDILSFKF